MPACAGPAPCDAVLQRQAIEALIKAAVLADGSKAAECRPCLLLCLLLHRHMHSSVKALPATERCNRCRDLHLT